MIFLAASVASTLSVIGDWANAVATLVKNRSIAIGTLRIGFINLLNQEPAAATNRASSGELFCASLWHYPRADMSENNLPETQDDRLARIRDRAHGCIVGGAIGDAMGGPFEGRPGPVRFKEHTHWSISDDSQLTFATCESIIEADGVSPEHIAQRFAQWYRARRITRTGASTLKALRDLDADVHWALAGAKGEMSAGNGAAMRIAPLAFHLDPDDDQDRRCIRDVCRITHHNEEAYAGALAVVIAIRSLAFSEVWPTNILETVSSQLPDSRVRDRIVELASLTNVSVADVAAKFGSSGYVTQSVPLALFAAHLIERHTFDELLRAVIEAGGDTDTNASMTGQVAGAWLGAAQISSKMIELLPEKNFVQQVSTEFAKTLKGSRGGCS